MITNLIIGLFLSSLGLVATAYIIPNCSKLNLIWSIPVFLLGFAVLTSCFRPTIM